MSLHNYIVTVGADGADGATRDLRVTSPTDVQAGDAAASLMAADEAILKIERVSQAYGLYGEPPRSQAAELAEETPGFASASDHPLGEILDDGQEEVFVREALETGRLEHHAGEERLGGGAARDGAGTAPARPSEVNLGQASLEDGQPNEAEASKDGLSRFQPSAGGTGPASPALGHGAAGDRRSPSSF